MGSNNLGRILTGAKSTIEASVMVGGTLLWKNYDAISLCVTNGLSIRFLFPRLTSSWLKDYIQSGGIDYREYVWRIRTNSDLARNLGAEVRFHDSPIAVWFALVDHQVVISKPVDMFGDPPLSISSSAGNISHFSNLFDSLWSKASNLGDSYQDRPGKYEERGETPLPIPTVFLCHASDDKQAVRDLYRCLAESGVKPWLDEVDILPGQDWDLEITRAVKRTDIVVVLLSRKSITKKGYLQKEIRMALDTASRQPEGTIFLIPARIEECDVPDSLGRWQYVDIFQPQGLEKLLQSIKSCPQASKHDR